MDETDASTTGSQPQPRPARRMLPAAILIAVLVLLGGGAVAAFAVPVVSLDSSQSLAAMLPASTAAYVSVDLNPSGSTKSNWDRIVHAFTDQPGWKKIAQTYTEGTQSSSTDKCYQQTQGQVSSNLDQLGHTSGFALLGSSGPLHSNGIDRALQRDAVFLASLHVHMTVAQAFSGFSLSLPQQATTYRGVAIYKETFPSCEKVSSSAPQQVYAALDKGYVVLGLQTAPIEKVIDVAAGAAPSLASQAAYRNLTAHIPSGSIAGYYVNGAAMSALGAPLGSMAPMLGTSTALKSKSIGSSAAGVYAAADGLHVVTAMPSSPGSRIVHPAGQIAAHLPQNTLALVSLQNVQKTLRSLSASLGGIAPMAGVPAGGVAPVLQNLTAHMSGEFDVVVGRPTGQLRFGQDTNLPLSVFWQVNSASEAHSDLVHLAHNLDANDTFRSMQSPAGASYSVTDHGYGYGVNRGWAVISMQVASAMTLLETTPAAPLSQIPALSEATAPGSTPGSVIYLDMRGIRQQIAPLLSANGAMYGDYVLPVLTPIQSIASKSATSADGNYTLGTTVIRINP